MKNRKLLISILTGVCACFMSATLFTACGEKEPPHTHIYDQQVINDTFKASEATCEDKAEYYYSCACGEKGTETFENGSALSHAYGDWISIGSNQHQKTCVNDNSHIITESCFGGTATCQGKAVCSVCNTVYGNLGEHSPKTTWVITDTHHYYECATLGCTEKLSHGEHSFTNYVSDKNATYESDGTKTAQCDFGCGKTNTLIDISSMLVRSNLTFKTLTVNELNVSGVVSNSTIEFSFFNEIQIEGNSQYVVSIDRYGVQTVASKTVPLSEGDNIFYIIETTDNTIKTYTVTIKRNYLYQVSFNTDCDSTIETQHVEEGKKANKPADLEKEGYNFIGWDFDFSTAVLENITVNAIWIPKDDVVYTLEYYQENINSSDYTNKNNYSLIDSVKMYGTTGSTIYPQFDKYEHFTVLTHWYLLIFLPNTGIDVNDIPNPVPSDIEGVIAPDGSTVLKVYYTRNRYDVTATKIDENGSISGLGSYMYGKQATLVATPNVGYIFDGWYLEDKIVSTNSTYSFYPEQNIELVAKWSARTDIEYTVKHYFENVDNSLFTIDESKTKTYKGTTGADVTINANEYEHFTAIEKTISGIVKGDGSLVLEIYYNRNEYTVTFDPNGGSFYSNLDEPIHKVKYQGAVLDPPRFYKKGYNYVYDTSIDAIAGNITVKALWTPNTYTIKFDLNGANGTISDTSVSYDDYFYYPNTDILREGYIFDGWYYNYTKIEEGTWSLDGGSIITLKAQWNPMFYVENGCITGVTTYGGALKEVIIPECIDGIRIYSIGDFAFGWGCDNVESVIVPNTITEIGMCAFDGCKNIKHLTVPFIGNRAIQYTSENEQYPLGYMFSQPGITHSSTHLTHIEQSFYEEYSTVTTYTYGIPSSLSSIHITSGNIQYGALSNCTMLKSVTIGEDVVSIQENALYNCSKLETINYNAISCSSVSLNAFAYAGQQSDGVSVFIGNKVLKVADNLFATSEDEKYSEPRIKTLSFENNSICSTIGSSAFDGCIYLQSVILPNSLEKIESAAFCDCVSLVRIILPSSLHTIETSAFYGCFKLVEVCNNSTINLTAGDTQYGRVAQYALDVITTLDDSKLVQENDFIIYKSENESVLISYIGNESDIVLPNNTTSIYTAAFYKMRDITSVVFNSQIASIGVSAFYGCNGLTTILLPDSVVSIETSAFSNCRNLHYIQLSSSLNNIGDSAFANCYMLVEVYNKSSLDIEKQSSTNGMVAFYALAVYNTPTNTKITVENGFVIFTNAVERILVGYYGNETKLAIPESITEIYQYAFYGFTDLVEVTVPDSVMWIGPNAFSGCTSLSNIYFLHTGQWWAGSNKTASTWSRMIASCESYDSNYIAKCISGRRGYGDSYHTLYWKYKAA